MLSTMDKDDCADSNDRYCNDQNHILSFTSSILLIEIELVGAQRAEGNGVKFFP